MADQLKGKLCCICIAVEVRSFEFVDSEPKQFLEKIFMDNGFDQLVSYGNLYICYECNALLEKTYKFVKKAFLAQQILLDMCVKSNMITLEQLKALNRKELGLDTTNLSISKFNVDYLTDADDSLYMDRKNKNMNEPIANLTLEDKYNSIKIECDSFGVASPIDNMKFNHEVIIKDNGTNLSNHETSFLKDECNTAKTENVIVEYIANASEENDHCNLKIDSLYIADPLNASTSLCEEVESSEKSIINVSDDDIDFCFTEDKQDIAEVCNDKSVIETSINKADPLADLNDVIDLENEEEANSKIRKKRIWPVKDTDPDFKIASSSKKSQKRKKRVASKNNALQSKQKIRDKTYKPSVFMQNLSSIADKKRTRTDKKYVYSDHSDDCNIKNMVYGERDYAYDPERSDDSHSESEESIYDLYDDEGRPMKKPDREYPMKCEHCEAEIPMKKVHFVHYLVAHPHIKYPYARKKCYTCQFCGYATQSMYHNREHELTHSTERAFACHICPKRFKNSTILKSHIRGRHSSIDYECDFCGKTFKSRSEITVHIRIHTGEKPFKCHICGVGYAHRGNVGVHIRSAHQGLTQNPGKKKKQKVQKKKRRTQRVKDSTIDEEDEPLVKDSTINEKDESLVKDSTINEKGEPLVKDSTINEKDESLVKDSTIDEEDEPLVKDSTINEKDEPLVKDSTIDEEDEPLIKVKKRKQKHHRQKLIKRRKRKHDSKSIKE